MCEADLLDMLSNGSSPEKIMKHIPKVFPNMKTLELDTSAYGRPRAIKWIAGVGDEIGTFHNTVPLEDKVEVYLRDVLDACRSSMLTNFTKSLKRYSAQPRTDWLMNKSNGNTTDLAQISLLVAGIQYVKEVDEMFDAIKYGNKDAFEGVQPETDATVTRLDQNHISTPAVSGRSLRVACLIMIDAHARDVVELMVKNNVQDASAFEWESQLKQRVENDAPCIRICDARFNYGFEYLGNGARLVIITAYRSSLHHCDTMSLS